MICQWFFLAPFSQENESVKNQRSTLIVDKEFQYKLVVPIAITAVLSANSVLLTIIFLLGSDIVVRLQTFLWAVALIEVVLIIVALYYGVKASHRIAGPVHRLKKILRQIADGDLTVRVIQRKHDHLQDLTKEINIAVATLESRILAMQTAIAREYSGDKEDMSSTLSELDRLLGQFKVSKTG